MTPLDDALARYEALQKEHGHDLTTAERQAFEAGWEAAEGGERDRLERAVIEAAKEFWEFGTDLYAAKLDAEVETLLTFEWEHGT